MRGLEQIPWLYDPLMRLSEIAGLGRWRRRVAGAVSGRVLEVGCGTGRNLPLYDKNARVVGTDPELSVLRKARSRAPDVPLVACRAEALPFRDAEFDAAVSTLVFCSVDDPASGFAELRRVLRPSGSLHMLEHVRSDNALGGWLQDRIQPAWTRVTGGCRPNRHTVERVGEAGFAIYDPSFETRGSFRRFVAHPDDTESSAEEIRSYYRTVGEFIELELATRRDEAYWRRTVDRLDAPAILELGAGTGRVTRLLAPEASTLVGVDLCPEMLQIASNRLDGASSVHLVLADMRDVAFSRSFDLVLAANDPFSHLPSDRDRDRALHTVARHLAPGGLFVLDALWFPSRSLERLSRPGGWHRTRELGDPEEGLSVDEWWRLDPESWEGEVRYEYRRRGRTVGRAAFRPRFWRPEEVERRFSVVGLTVQRMLGGYDERPWERERSRHLIVEARAE